MRSALRVNVVAVGAFGHAVAEHLGSTSAETADAVVLAAWGPQPTLAAAVEERAFTDGIPWLPVVLEHPQLRVGPAVVPGAGACNACFEAARAAQRPPAGTASPRLYAADLLDGPQRFLAPLAALAAGAASALLAWVAADPTAAAGRVQQLDVVTHHATSARAIPGRGCPRCGPAVGRRRRAAVEELLA